MKKLLLVSLLLGSQLNYASQGKKYDIQKARINAGFYCVGSAMVFSGVWISANALHTLQQNHYEDGFSTACSAGICLAIAGAAIAGNSLGGMPQALQDKQLGVSVAIARPLSRNDENV